jgi:hypothetical protein
MAPPALMRYGTAMRNQTLLSTIDDMLLSLECSCGHRAEIEVAGLIPRMEEEATVQDVVDAARCRACGCRGTIIHTRIVYALPGTRAPCTSGILCRCCTDASPAAER